MKISIDSKELSKALKSLSLALPSRSVLPIIENFLFEIQGNTLIISATNLEISMRTELRVEGNTTNDLNCAVPAKITQNVLSNIPPQPIAIHFQDNSMEIHTSEGKYRVSIESGKGFPSSPVPVNDFFKIGGSVISRAFDKVMFAASSDEDRGALNGVYIISHDTGIDFVGTDAHKFQLFRSEAEISADMDFILPLRAAKVIKSLTGNAPISMSINNSNAFFQIGSITVCCRLIDHKYPDYVPLIPTSYRNLIKIDKNKLISALSRLKPFANDVTGAIKLICKNDSLTLECEDVDFGNKASESIAIAYEGEDMEIGFKVDNLFLSVSKIDTEVIKIQTTQPNQAAVILPDSQEPGETITGLVMPIRLHSYAMV